jgi:hypothetical protein
MAARCDISRADDGALRSGTMNQNIAAWGWRSERKTWEKAAPWPVLALFVNITVPALFAGQQRPRRLVRPRTSPFHGGNTGSNPVGDANKQSIGTGLREVVTGHARQKVDVSLTLNRHLHILRCGTNAGAKPKISCRSDCGGGSFFARYRCGRRALASSR